MACVLGVVTERGVGFPPASIERKLRTLRSIKALS
jgi:hypothetical protein